MEKKKSVPFKELNLHGNYVGFGDFYDENKSQLYKSIIEVFHEFKKTRKKKLTLYVSSKIKDLQWDTEFNFTKADSKILKRDILPYFSELEDYETCGEIIKLHKELTM